MINNDKPIKITQDQVEYLCGMGAAAGSVWATYPVNKIMFRQSLWGFDMSDAIRQLKIEGLGYLYRGCLPPMLTKSLTSGVMFGTFHQYQQMLIGSTWTAPDANKDSLGCTFFAAMFAGSTEALLTPLERVAMILQDGRYNHQYRNTIDAFFKIRRYGLAEYYRGISAILMRNGPATFLYFGFKDRLKEFLIPSNGSMPMSRGREMARDFVSGALLGSSISTLFYPLNVIRIQMQIQEVGTEHIGVWETATTLYREREGNAQKLLSGVYVNIARSFLYWGFMTLFSEMWRHYFYSSSRFDTSE